MKRIASLALGFTLAALLLAPASASALVTTIGSSLANEPTNTLVCPGGCTASNFLLPSGALASGGINSPVNGVVVRWRIRSGPTAFPTALRILRPGNSTTRTGAGTGAIETPVANTTSTFATRLPIQAGDAIGVDATQFYRAPTVSATGLSWPSKLEDGGTPVAGTVIADRELPINADIEVDGDGDGYGDESQDLCPLSASTPGAGCSLTVTVEEGEGRLIGPGIDCPGDCTANYPTGTVVPLRAVPERGFATSQIKLSHMSCQGASFSECSFTIFQDTTAEVTFGDIRPPQTTITKAPGKRTTKRKVKFRFSSDEPGTFQCALDKEKFRAGQRCTSPHRLKVEPGKHTFYVRAVDVGNLVDTTPAKAKFKVVE